MRIFIELRDLYDSKRILTGEVIEKGQDVLVTKDGKWATNGGYPKSGESSLQGIVTEIEEELGQIVNENKLTLFKTIQTEDGFVDLYYMKKDINIDIIVVQEDEVETAKWSTREEMEQLIKEDKFSKSHEEFYKEWLLFFDN